MDWWMCGCADWDQFLKTVDGGILLTVSAGWASFRTEVWVAKRHSLLSTPPVDRFVVKLLKKGCHSLVKHQGHYFVPFSHFSDLFLS